MEQNNDFLLDQLKNYERNFEMQMAKFSKITDGERENRERIEKIFTIFSDQTFSNTSELKSKVNFIQEIFEKEEKWKFEQRQKDFEVYKNIISTITEKITETVKAEVDMRFKADMDNKIYTQNLGNKLMRELEFVKREIDEVSKENRDLTKETSKECSERTVNLSRYVDQMIAKAGEDPLKNYEKIKNAVNKLTEQVKNNMQFQSDFNKILEEKVNYLTDNNVKDKDKKVVDLTDLEKRTDKKLKEMIFYIENIFKANASALNERIDNLSANTDKNLNFITNQLIDTRKKLISKIHEVEEKGEKEFTLVVEDLEQIVSRIDNYETILAEYHKANEDTKSKINKTIAEFQSKYETKFINEKMQRELENEDLQDIIAKSNNDIIELGEITNNQLESMTKNFEKENNLLVHKFNQISDRIDDMNKNNYELFDGLENNAQKIIFNNVKTDVENLMNSILNEFETKDKIENIIIEVENKLRNSELNVNYELDKIDKIIGEQIESVRISMQNGFDSVYEKFNVDVEDKMKLIESDLKYLKDNMALKAPAKETDENNAEENKLVAQEDKSEDEKIAFNLINDQEFKMIIDQIKSEIAELSENFVSLNEKYIYENNAVKEKFGEVEDTLLKKKNISDPEAKQKKLNSIAEYEAKNAIENLITKIEIEKINDDFNEKIMENESSRVAFTEKLESFKNEIEEVKKLLNEINESSIKIRSEYLDIMESKLENIFEKIKKDNLDLWNCAVQEMGRYNGLDGNFIFNLKIFLLI